MSLNLFLLERPLVQRGCEKVLIADGPFTVHKVDDASEPLLHSRIPNLVQATLDLVQRQIPVLIRVHGLERRAEFQDVRRGHLFRDEAQRQLPEPALLTLVERFDVEPFSLIFQPNEQTL